MLNKKYEFMETKIFFLNLLKMLDLVKGEEDIERIEETDNGCIVIIKKGERERIKCYWDTALEGPGLEDYELLLVLGLKQINQKTNIFDLKEIVNLVNKRIAPKSMDIADVEKSLKKLAAIKIIKEEKEKVETSLQDYFIPRVDLRNN